MDGWMDEAGWVWETKEEVKEEKEKKMFSYNLNKKDIGMCIFSCFLRQGNVFGFGEKLF